MLEIYHIFCNCLLIFIHSSGGVVLVVESRYEPRTFVHNKLFALCSLPTIEPHPPGIQILK